MIKVGVGQKHSIDVFRLNWKGFPISGSEVPFLIQTAVDQNLPAINRQEVPRTGDIPSRPEKL